MARPAPPALSRKLRQASVATTEAELSSLLAISRVHHADALALNPMNFGGSLADAALALKLPSTGALIDGQIKSGDNNRIAMEMLRGRENQVADDIRRVERSPKITGAHSMTLSARPDRVSGIASPSAFAVLRLITSSTTCWTRRSARSGHPGHSGGDLDRGTERVGVVVMARNHAAFDVIEPGFFCPAARDRVRAARVEAAAGRRVERARHLACEDDLLAPLVGMAR